MLDEVRATLRERGRTRTQWEVGSSAPPGLVDALLDAASCATRTLCGRARAHAGATAVRRGARARRVETFEEYAAAHAVQWEAFGRAPRPRSPRQRVLPQRFRETGT